MKCVTPRQTQTERKRDRERKGDREREANEEGWKVEQNKKNWPKSVRGTWGRQYQKKDEWDEDDRKVDENNNGQHFFLGKKEETNELKSHMQEIYVLIANFR